MSGESDRASRLATAVAQESLDWLLVADEHDLRWLTGFTGTSGVALFPADAAREAIFVTDFRYVEQATAQLSDRWRIERASRDLLGAGLAEATGSERFGRLGFDAGQVTVFQHRALAEALGGRAELVEADSIVAGLRQVKDEREIEQIAAACSLADEALAAVLGRGLRGRSEREVAIDLEITMIGLGAQGASFPPIVAGGSHGALPHAEPREVEIPGGCLVTIDWGARLDGYCSDCTRTFATGPLSDEEIEVYRLVDEARRVGIEALVAGRTGREVDGAAREVIVSAGYGECFGHGLGHGVGLDVHEEPRLSSRGGTAPLESGTVVTVEPGIYLPGRFGVRIEDLLVVAGEQPRCLTTMERALTEVS